MEIKQFLYIMYKHTFFTIDHSKKCYSNVLKKVLDNSVLYKFLCYD